MGIIGSSDTNAAGALTRCGRAGEGLAQSSRTHGAQCPGGIDRTRPRERGPPVRLPRRGRGGRPPRRRRAASWGDGPRRWSRPGRRVGRGQLRPIARTPARPSALTFPDRRSDLLARGHASPAAASSTLKATSGGRAATSTAPAVGCRRGGPKSGAARRRRPRCSSAGPAPPQLGAGAAGGQQAVEEHGQLQLISRAARRRPAPRRTPHPGLGGQEDHRRDIDRADVRVHARVGADRIGRWPPPLRDDGGARPARATGQGVGARW